MLRVSIALLLCCAVFCSVLFSFPLLWCSSSAVLGHVPAFLAGGCKYPEDKQKGPGRVPLLIISQSHHLDISGVFYIDFLNIFAGSVNMDFCVE